MAGTLDLERLSPADLNALGVEQLQRIVDTLTRLRAHQDADPELRSTILRRVDEALSCGRITEEQAKAIRSELDEVVPAVVLEGHIEELVDLRRPALGAFPRHETPAKAPDLVAWYRDDPRRLIGYMREAARFTNDEDRVLRAVADFAERLGIPDPVAEEVLAEGLRAVRAAWREKGAGRAS